MKYEFTNSEVSKIKKLLLILSFLIIFTGCNEKTNSPDLNEVERLKKELQDLKDEVKERDKELEKLRDIEKLYNYQVTIAPIINMYSSMFLYDLQINSVEDLNERTHEELQFEEKSGEIYAVTPNYEIKITYNNDKQTLKRWFIDLVSFDQKGNIAEVTVRPHYFNKNNESVQEDRYFKLYYEKTRDDWFLKDISL